MTSGLGLPVVAAPEPPVVVAGLGGGGLPVGLPEGLTVEKALFFPPCLSPSPPLLCFSVKVKRNELLKDKSRFNSLL